VTDRAPPREPIWRAKFARLFDFGGPAPAPDGEGDTQFRRVEELIMGGPRRYTRAQLIAESGLDRDEAVAMWRSLVFAEVGDDEVVFTAGDRAALRQLGQLREAGLIPADVQDAVGPVGRPGDGRPGRLADRDALPAGRLRPSWVSEREMLGIAERVIPLLESMQSYVWRRHVAAAATRLLATMPGESDTRTLTVGFADLVGFTRATRR